MWCDLAVPLAAALGLLLFDLRHLAWQVAASGDRWSQAAYLGHGQAVLGNAVDPLAQPRHRAVNPLNLRGLGLIPFQQ
jgi:hypothetical protein